MPQIVQRAVTQAIRAKGLTNAQMREERADQSSVQRLLKIAGHRTAGQMIVAAIGRSINAQEYMGAGMQQAVFGDRQKNLVHKVLFESIGLDTDGAEALAAIHQANFNTAEAYLGDFYIPTKFRPVRLAGLLGGCAVIATQPMVNPLVSFAHPSGIWRHSRDAHYINEQKTLHDRIGHLYKATGMFPDLYGVGNVVVVDDREEGTEHIRIPDTIPETRETGLSPMWTDQPQRPETRQQVFEQFHSTWRTEITE